MSDDPLVLRFDPQTVDHLGARMYSHLPNAVAELVANAYDANAHHVAVIIGADGSITVDDDGHGMSRDEVRDKYLHIGRNRRKTEDTNLTEGGLRRVSGKKGLGKLALFGIGKRVVLTTSRFGSAHGVQIELSYDAMMGAEGEYRPAESTIAVSEIDHGTKVVLSELKRKTPVKPKDLATSLARLFNYTDDEFQVTVVHPDGARTEVTPALRLDSIDEEFVWNFPEDFGAQDRFLYSRNVRGKIISSVKPLKDIHRGITLYASGRLVNEPEFFGASESSYAYSYLTGLLEVDFIDDEENDVIATDRRAIDWETDLTAQFREALQKLIVRLGREWRTRRSEARKQTREKSVGHSTEEWTSSIKSERERQSVQRIVDHISDLDLTVEQESALIQDVSHLAPPNADFVWRHLHAEIRNATRVYYERGDYYQAVMEAIKRFVNLTTSISGLTTEAAFTLVGEAFGSPKGRLTVLGKFADTAQFSPATKRNMENGQKHLSMGVIAGFRDPLAHEEIQALQDTGAFTYQDCLDALSIVSHLTRRLTAAEIRTAADN